MHILVVEENEVTRKLVSGILNKKGYATFEAASGDAALPFLAKNLKMIVMDVDNQSASNMGLLRKVHLHHSRVPLLVMSEETDEQALAARLNLPQISVIRKPVMPAHLLACISNNLVGGVEKKAEEPPAPVPLHMEAEDPAIQEQRRGFMRRAIDLSQEKMDENCGGPFGAIVVRNGQVIAEGWNAVTSTNDPTAHAEVVAIRAATQALGTFDLTGCEIYTSCEPCPMCLSAMYWARIDRFFYGNTREDAGAIGFDDDFIYREIPLDESRRTLKSNMLLRDEAQIVFKNWIKKADKTEY